MLENFIQYCILYLSTDNLQQFLQGEVPKGILKCLISFWRRGGGQSPPGPIPERCPRPTGGLGGHHDPRADLLFSIINLLFHFLMKTLIITSDPKHLKVDVAHNF